MKDFVAFLKKEYLETIRTGRLMILLCIFALFGIMAPAVAKLTPWLIGTMSDSLGEMGMTVGSVTINALTSWEQFFKNAPMALCAFVLMCSNTITKEFEQGTLIPVVTKGLSITKILLAKGLCLTCLWTICYTVMFLITYGYNVYFWDNSIVENFANTILNWWFFGFLMVCGIMFFSSVAKSNVIVLIGCGVIAVLSTVLEMFSSVANFLPTKLIDAMSLLKGAVQLQDYTQSIIVTAILCLICIFGSVICIKRKAI